jgi:hypothetical protein
MMSEETTFQRVKRIMQQPDDMPETAPYSDDDLEQLYRQEPLPPNQGFMLPAEEQPIESEHKCTYPV